MSYRCTFATRFLIVTLVLFGIFACASDPVPGATAEISFSTGDGALQQKGVSTSDLIKLKDIDTLSVSPDGKLIAFQVRQADPSNRRYKNEWFVSSTTGDSSPVFLGQAGVPRLAQLKNMVPPPGNIDQPRAIWSPNSEAFSYPISFDGKNYSLGISFVDSKSSRTTSVEVSEYPELTWSNDSSKVFFARGNDSNIVDQEALRIEGDNGFLYDDRFKPLISTKPTSNAAFDFLDGFLERPHLEDLMGTLRTYSIGDERSAASTPAEIEQFVSYLEIGDPMLVGKAVGLSEPMQSKFDAGIDYFPVPTRFDSSGELIAWVDLSRPGDSAFLAEVTVRVQSSDDQEPRVCTDPACSGLIRGLWGAEDGRSVFFFKVSDLDGSLSTLYRWDLRQDEVQLLHSSHTLFNDCQLAINRLICLRASPTQPDHIVGIDLESGDVKSIFDPNEDFKSLRKGHVERIEWESESGHRAFAYLVKPADYVPGKKYPLVITTYKAKGFLRGGTGDEFPIYPMAEQGIMVLSYNDAALNKGAYSKDENEGIFDDYTDWAEKKGNLALIDGVIDRLVADGLVDKSRLAITGLSFGAALTHYALIHSRHDFTAASATSAAYSTVQYHAGGPSLRKTYGYMGLGDPDGASAEDWAHIASELNTEKIDTAVLIQVSDMEFLMSMRFITSMEQDKKPVEAYVFPDDYHTKYWPQHRDAAYTRNVQWMKFWLLDKETDSPISEGQYERWRSMRAAHCQGFQTEFDKRPAYCEAVLAD